MNNYPLPGAVIESRESFEARHPPPPIRTVSDNPYISNTGSFEWVFHWAEDMANAKQLNEWKAKHGK